MQQARPANSPRVESAGTNCIASSQTVYRNHQGALMLASSTSSLMPVTSQATVPQDATAVPAAPETQAAVPRAEAEAELQRENPWQQLIEGDQLAALEVSMVSDDEVVDVAKLCLEQADAHPEAVKRALFMNSNVRNEALKLLEVNDQYEPDLQKALALCFLDAGYELQGRSLAPQIAELLVERKTMEDEYWASKQEKHAIDRGVPFFYKDTKYSQLNHNGQLKSSDEPGALLYWCRHMETAAAENTKTYLQDISKPIPDVSKLDYQLLEAAEKASRGAPTINFTPGNMGKLLMRLALHVKVGEPRSFRVGWLDAGTGHGMRIFLEKTDEGFFKVGLYEPNVSGNVSHQKVLPEKLASLRFDDFDTEKVRGGSNRAVLALEVESAELAKSCAGTYVTKRHFPSQIDTLGQALAHGNLWEMDSALALLGEMEWPDSANLQDAGAERLANTVHVALADGRDAALEKFMAGLKHLHFTSEQIALIVTAAAVHATDDAGNLIDATGLHAALKAGNAKAVEAFMAGLTGLSLKPEQIAHIVEARDSRSIPGLYFAIQHGHADSVQKFMAGLKDLELAPAQIGEIVAARINRSALPSLYTALQRGNDAAVGEFLSRLKELDLTGQQIIDIVAAKDANSTSGLHRALAAGHHGAIEKYLANLAGLRLTPEQTAEIAAAKDNRGDPGMSMALRRGHGAAVQKLLENLHSLNLAPEQIVDIAAAKNSMAIPGLFLALQNGQGKVVKAFMAGLKSLDGLGLTSAQFAEMIASKDPRRNSMVPALNLVLKRGDAVAVAEFMAGLQALQGLLTPTDIVEIVLAKDADGTSGLYAALVAGQGAAVEAFINGLQGLGGPGGLAIEAFAEVLRAPGSAEDPPALEAARDRGHADTVERFYQALSRSRVVRPRRRIYHEAE